MFAIKALNLKDAKGNGQFSPISASILRYRQETPDRENERRKIEQTSHLIGAFGWQVHLAVEAIQRNGIKITMLEFEFRTLFSHLTFAESSSE